MKWKLNENLKNQLFFLNIRRFKIIQLSIWELEIQIHYSIIPIEYKQFKNI